MTPLAAVPARARIAPSRASIALVFTGVLTIAGLTHGRLVADAHAQGGGAGSAEESVVRPQGDPSRSSDLRAAQPFADRRAPGLLNILNTVTPNDSFLLVSHGFQDLAGNCATRGWTGVDLTGHVFAHPSGRFTVNDGFVNMGTRALWFGADTASDPAEVANWVKPYGYGNGWSQRLTSPTFSLVANPTAVLRFDASMQLRRNIDNAPTSNFTPYGLVSGKIANDFLAAEAKMADGSWQFLTGRWSVAGGPAWDATPPLFANRWTGIPGGTAFVIPSGVAVDDSGNVYVADTGNNRIVKYTRTGTFLTTWGTAGSGAGQFNSPSDVAVDDSFHVFVADRFNNRVQKFANDGTFLKAWGSFGAGSGNFSGPRGIAVDPSHNVYVTDNGNWLVQKFSSMGVFSLQWGTFGSGAGQFQAPGGIAITAAGQVLVTDGILNRVQRFSSSGAFISSWGSTGSGDGQFNSVGGLDVDRDGNVWVADQSNHRIQKFTPSGSFLLKTGTFGASGGHFFNGPLGIGVSKNGDIYVADTNNQRVQWFAIGGPIAGENTFKYEARLRSDGNENLALAEPVQVRVVMQSNHRASAEDGFLFSGQDGVILVDNVSVQDAGAVDLVPIADFESGTTGSWALSALNGGYSASFNTPSAVRDTPAPATSVALRSGYDLYDPTCVWTFLSPGDTLATGTYARLVSPWIALVPGDSQYVVMATSRLNTLGQSRFVYPYARAKRIGDTTPRQYHAPAFIFYGTNDPNEAASPLTHDWFFRFPQDFSGINPPLAMDSIQVVFDVLDQPERLLGVLPQQRPTAHTPILDDVEVLQLGVDSDFDGVADALDGCPSVCAAGQDANGDGCVDSTATLHHVESWANGEIQYTISEPGSAPNSIARVLPAGSRAPTPAAAFAPADILAIEAGFNTWLQVPGASVPLSEAAPITQANASAFDGINLVTRDDSEYQFPPGVLAVTPTTSFTRRTVYGDRIVLPGEIVDADMILNPKTAWTTSGEVGKQDLQSVVTHEAGHFLGLSHSGVLDATMFFVIQPGQDAQSLTDDDRAAIAAAYPDPGLATSFATIRGTVYRGQTGLALPGALVEAVRLTAGGALLDTTASDYTAEDGTYALRRLPAGDYSVRITPLDGNVGGYPLSPEYINARLLGIAQTVFVPEWWNAGESDRDDPALRDPITVVAGQVLSNINITTTVDTIPPFVTSTLPANNDAGVKVDSPILINFNEPVIADSIPAAFRVRKNGVPPSLGGIGQILAGKNFVFTPTNGLEYSSSYEIEISPAIRDLEGLAMADTFRTVFTTQAQPPLAITDIQPRSAPVGALITISGASFYPTGNVSVAFNGCGAIPVSAANVTTTSIVVRVELCATTGPVTVTTPGGSVVSSFNLTVLPPAPQAAPVPNGNPVALGFSPTDAAVSPDGHTVFAAGDGAFVSVDLTAPLRPVTTHAQGTFRGLALTPDGGRALLTRPGTGDVLVFGATPGNNLGLTLATIPVGGTPGGVAVSPNGRRAYVTDQLDGRTHEIDIDPASPAPYTPRRDLLTPGAVLSGGAAVSLDGTRLYLSSSNLGLLEVTLNADPPVVAVLNPTPNAGGMVIVPSGAEVLAPGATFTSSLVLASFPTQGGSIPGEVPLDGAPRDVGVSPAGQSAYVVNSQTNQMDVINVDPGSGIDYHKRMSTVSTGRSPLSVGVSSLSSVIAVANFADRSLSIYTTSGANTSIVGVVPDIVLPDGQAAVITFDDIYSGGTTVDLGSGPFAAQYPSGQGVGFTVPVPDRQRATTLTLSAPGGGDRSLALPFAIVDPILTFVPRDGGVTLVPNPTPLGAGEPLDLKNLRLSPDGRLLAVGRTRSVGSGAAQVQYWWAGGASGTHAFGSLAGSSPVSGAIGDVEFTADGKQVWALDQSNQVSRFDADPSSLQFSQPISTLPPQPTEPLPTNLAADPLMRFMYVGGDSRLLVYTPAGSLQSSIPSAAPVRSLAGTPDGQYLVVGGPSNGKIFVTTTLYSGSATPLATTPTHANVDFARVAISTNGRRAAAITNGNQIAIWNLDAAAGPIGQELFFGTVAGVPSPISQIVPAPDGTGFLLGCNVCGTLARLNAGTVPPTVTTSTPGYSTESLARSTDGRRLWIGQWTANLNAATVRLFNLGEATQLSIVDGQGQSQLPGQTLAAPIRVRFTDTFGNPVEGLGARFHFAAPVGSGLLDGQFSIEAVKITDVNGEAQVQWTLPPTLGTFSLLVDGLGVPVAPLVFNAEVVPTDANIVPLVEQFGPAPGASAINAGTAVFARFNQRMNTTSVEGKMRLAMGDTPAVTGTFRFEDEGRVAIFQPKTALLFGAPCTLYVEAGAADLENQLTAQRQSSAFTVESPPALSLSALTPPAAGTGATVVISGEGFSTTPSANIVTFAGVLAPVEQASLTSLTTSVPVNAASGDVVVRVGNATSLPLPFSVLTPNTNPGTVVGTVDDNPGVSRIVFTPDGTRAYVTNPNRNSVSVLDIASATVIKSITVGSTPKGICILPDGSRVYVANSGSHNVSVIDSKPGSNTYNTVVGTIEVDEGPVDVVASGVGPRVYVANARSGTVSIIDANADNGTFDHVVTTVNTGAGCGTIAVDPDASRMYVGTGDGIVMVDLGSLVVTTVNSGSGCGSITIDPDATILIALLANGDLIVIDIAPGSTNFNKVVCVVNTGSGAGTVDISPDAALAYISSADGNKVSVYKITRSDLPGSSSFTPGPKVALTLVATIPVGSAPSDIALDPTGRNLGLVPNAGSGTITFIGLPTSLPPVAMGFDMNPNSLNLKSMGKWVSATLTPIAPFVPADIVVSSIRLNGVVAVDPDASYSIDSNTLTVKFPRTALQLILPEGDNVPVNVTGLVGARDFAGVDYIKVKAGKVTKPHVAEIVDPRFPYTLNWNTSNGVHVEWVAVLHSLDHGATWKLDATHLPNSGSAAWNPPDVLSDSVRVAVVEVETSTPGDTSVTGVLGVSDYFRLQTPTSAEPLPVRLEFSPIAPSPSHGTVTMRYGLPRATRVDLEVFDIQGRRLRSIVAGDQEAGWHQATWSGETDTGARAGTGLYFARFRAEGRVFRQRMIWIR